MRKIAITLNLIVVFFFAGFLSYTFVARKHLEAIARIFVTEKTLHYSEPIVALAEASFDSPMVKKLLSDKQNAAIRHEITEYHHDPAGYIADLTRQKLKASNPMNPNPLLQKAASIKDRIRSFYDNTLAALISDLRIFSTSNLCVGLITFGLAYWSRKNIQKSIIWFSFLMFVTVLYCSYLYVDGLTFFRVLFRTHMGWWYPLLMCVILAGLYVDYGRAGRVTEHCRNE